MRLWDLLPALWGALLASLCSCCGAASDNVFTIRHEKNNQCIQVKNLQLLSGSCQETKETLWTWVSQHRLFNLGSQKCLGLDVSGSQNHVKMVDCDSRLILWWQCADALVFSVSKNKLALKDGVVTASVDSADAWRRNNSSDVICKYPYREIYTRDGNAYGKPCEFPFLVNGTWHHDCIQNGWMEGEWCYTTSNSNREKKWGLCLKQEDGCQNTWEHDANSGSCYQLNTQAALTWKEAYVSCQRQGGDLLSISSLAELNSIQGKDGIAQTFWIGLNQLDISGGWQWSDHTPLNFLSWSPDLKDSSPLDGFGCVAMSAELGQWMSYPCEIGLPYVCKKQLNKTKSEFTEVQNYMETRCDSNWFPHNGFCYILSNSSASWDDAEESCKTNNTDLISIHSLADVELLVVELHIETNDKVWTGFVNKETPAFFKWSDGSKVEFTYWDQDEPKIPFNSTPNCVAYSAELGRWSVLSCKEKLKYVCRKKGEILNETKSDKDCPSNEVWKKHGDFCYKIEKVEVSFEKNCNLTITNRFEQEFINSLIRKHAKVEEKYIWIGLQDTNSLGEYRWGSTDGKSERLTYTNWNNLQPAFSGGCVAMSSGRYLGKWEVQDCKTFKAYSVCKKYIGPQKEPEILPKVTDPCPPGWYNGSGLACYKFFHKERLLRTRTWEEAERFCEALGGHLPSFTNMLEVKMLHDTLRKIISDERWVWIGLNKRNPESLGSWQWSDNKPVSAVVPYNFEEDDYETRDCAAIKILKNIHRYYWPFHLEDEEEDFYMKPFHCSSKLEWVCQITKGSSPKIPVWYKPDQDGIHGLPLTIDGSEFWFEPNKHLSYQEAALYCSRNGSDLAAVTSFTALEAILNTIANLSDENQKWWLKYSPATSRNPHYFRYLSRHSYEPYSRDCAHVSSRSWSRYDIISCGTKLPFICEKVNISLLETHDPDYKPPQKSCVDGWTVFLNKCYRTVTPQHLKFGKAKEYCQSHGGMLPSIKTPAEQDFITSLLPNMPEAIWIGLSIKRHALEKKWVDGSVLGYSNFHPLLEHKLRMFPPYWLDDINLCGVLLNDPKLSYVGTWNFTSCEETLSVAICEREADSVKNQTQEASTVTVNYQNVTYTLILKNLTWFDAQEECLQKNMQLVSITEQYQQAFLAVQVAQHNYQLWTGLSSKDDGNNYQWSDGKHVQFSRWSNDDGDLADDCVYLDSDGFWKTYECYSELPGAICYLPRNETERTEVLGSIKCPHKVKNTPWIPFQNSCYAFMITKGRWKEIKSNEVHHLCKQINENASLLSIKDEKENNFVVEQLQSFGGFAQWLRLGLIYQPADDLLKWYDETHVIYHNWRLGRPSIKNNFVAGINLDGFWDIDSHGYSQIYSHGYSHIDRHRSILACKIEMVPKEDKPPLPKKLNYGNDSYWILQEKLSWYKAWGECKQSGGNLASIHDEAQQLFLEDIVKRDGFPLWLGLSIHDGNESDFQWSDESAFDYKPWEYEHSRSSGNCFYLDTKGFWNRKKCSDNVDGAICYSPLKKMQSRKTENPTTCPQTTSESSWIQYKGHCYAFDMSFYNFSIYNGFAAKTVCKKLDPSATVLTIKDPEENKFVMTHLREHSFITVRVWLGMISQAKSSLWLDGSEVKYTNWAKGMRASGQCSIIFSTNGTWSQIDCLKDESRVVCKAPQVFQHMGGAIAVAIFIILAFLGGLIFFLYKKKRIQWRGFSSVRYERGMHDDETDSMFTRDGN